MAQWATTWTLGEKSKVHFCKIQLVLDILQTMDYLMALKVLLQSSAVSGEDGFGNWELSGNCRGSEGERGIN